MRSTTPCLLITAICLLLFLAVHAQPRPPKAVSRQEIAVAVDTIAALLKRNYVYEEKGAQIAAHLLEQHKQNAFSGATDWRIFDSLATAILRGYGKDGHLYVRYDPEQVKAIRSEMNMKAPAPGEDDFHHGKAAAEKNYGFRELRILEGNVGYIRLSEMNFSIKSRPLLYAAMQFVARTKALVIDLRNNGGGGSEVGPVFESFFLPANTPLLEFKNREGKIKKDMTWNRLPQEKYDKPLYILVDKGTASAAEAFTYVLQAHKRAIVIGQPSAGAANMNTFYPVNDEVFVSISTMAPSLPGTQESWEQKGVQPDHVTASEQELPMTEKLAAANP